MHRTADKHTKYKYIDCITYYLNKPHCNQLFELGLGKVKFRFFSDKICIELEKNDMFKVFFLALHAMNALIDR